MGIITDKTIIDKIEDALAEIRPFLESDGGDINFIELTDEWVVKVKLIGACSSCSISLSTLKNGFYIVSIYHEDENIRDIKMIITEHNVMNKLH